MRKVTEDFIGTCQACFGEFKVNEKSKQIVFHGYQRPGIGYTVGQCSGTDHAPFEYDNKLTKKIIGVHRESSIRSESYLAALNAGEVLKLTRYYQEYNRETFRHVDRSEEVQPGHKYWDHTLRATIAQTEGNITYHTRVADYLQRMVDDWKPGQIVGIDVPATGKERALRKAYDPAEADAAEARAKEKAARDAKPGKLKVLFYRPEFPRNPNGYADDQEGWRKWIEAKDAQTKAFTTGIKAWVKANIEGKTLVRECSDFDLPRSIRGNGDFDVVSVHLPWEYLDRVTELFPTAETFETENKKRSFTVVGGPA